MHYDKKNQLQGYLNDHLVSRPCDWNALKATLQTASEMILNWLLKKKECISLWFDENDMHFHTLLKNKKLQKLFLRWKIGLLKS